VPNKHCRMVAVLLNWEGAIPAAAAGTDIGTGSTDMASTIGTVQCYQYQGSTDMASTIGTVQCASVIAVFRQ